MTYSASTSGKNKSYWIDSISPSEHETLSNDMQTDVLIIGGGISGLTTAYKLLESGLSVLVVEDGLLGSGETGRTTAHLSYVLGEHYYEYEKIFGYDNCRLIAESHQHAIDEIENIIHEEKIDADFLRLDGYLFLHSTDKKENLQKEYEMTQKMGLPTKWIDTVPGLEAESSPAIKFPHQAQFHVMKYLTGLAKAIEKKGGKIFTHSKASDISEEGAVVNGHTITAKHIVVATNSPINDRFAIHSKQFAYRSYVIGALIDKGSVEPTLRWDTGDQDNVWVGAPYHYIRTQSYNDTHDLLIIGGEDHKTGQADRENIPEEERYIRLISRAKKRFPHMQDIVFQWSGQVLEPADYIAFIGRNVGDENIYIITGDSGNGMTHGTLGGMIISDLINKKKNKYASLYSPSRGQLHAGFDYIKEVLNLTEQYGMWLTPGDKKTVRSLKAGQGAILRDGLKKLAVYRDEKEKLHIMSAVCPHLGGILAWNNDEKSFDCPVHGSRFDHHGKVIMGPANSDLKKEEGHFEDEQ